METDDQFDTLSTVLEQFDARGWPVRHVEATLDGPDGADAGPLSVSIEVPVGVPGDDGTGPPVTPERATVTPEGDLRVDCRVADPPAPGADHPAVTVRDRSARLDDDGEVLLVVDLRVRSPAESEPRSAATALDGAVPDEATDDGDRDRTSETDDDREDGTGGPTESEGRDRSTALAAVRDESVPPYEDTEYLRHLYETCDTFSEMSRIIEMDVAAETVRRYMIDAGIHDPDSYDTAREDPSTDGGPGGNGDGELVADGIGLPEDVDREELIRAVVDAKTVYEVRRELGLDGSRVRELLRELRLLDLVCGRIDEDPANRTTREQVTARLRQSAGERTTGAPTH